MGAVKHAAGGHLKGTTTRNIRVSLIIRRNHIMSVEQKEPALLRFHLTDGTRIEIRHACPLTMEDAHKESCRWAERLELLLPRGEMFGEATLAAA